MAATVIINEYNTAGASATDKTSGTIRMKNADNAAVDTNNPMVIPSSGVDFSYEKWLRCYCTVPPSTQLTNLQFYTDGTNGLGTGVGLFARTSSAFSTPAEAVASTGYTDVFSYKSPSSTLDMGMATVTASGAMGDFLILMMTVASTATQGTTPSETLTWSYDEI